MVEGQPGSIRTKLDICKSDPPFDDERVRLALSLAIDREAINDRLFGGTCTKEQFEELGVELVVVMMINERQANDVVDNLGLLDTVYVDEDWHLPPRRAGRSYVEASEILAPLREFDGC